MPACRAVERRCKSGQRGFCGCSSAVEHLLAKQDVEGANPFTRFPCGHGVAVAQDVANVLAGVQIPVAASMLPKHKE